MYKKLLVIFVIFIGTVLAFLPRSNEPQTSGEALIKDVWPEQTERVEIESTKDQEMQDAFFIPSTESAPLIVSLHQWSASFDRFDPLSQMAAENNWNYIRPDFRGPSNRPEAGGSELVISDLDDAIRFATKNGQVDLSEIHIIGASGGGHAALMHLMRGQEKVTSYSVWVPIVDLVAWYGESQLRGNGYDRDILAITGSKGQLNVAEARRRSPLHQETPVERISETEVHLFAGIDDGYKGSVPVSHSINFYNKLIYDLGLPQENAVSTEKSSKLVHTRQYPETDPFVSLGNRPVLFRQKAGNLSLTIFEGDHEILYNRAFDLIHESIH